MKSHQIKENLIGEVLAIPKETIATLTGIREVAVLDQVRKEWVLFIQKNPLKFTYKGWTWAVSWRSWTLYSKRISAGKRV